MSKEIWKDIPGYEGAYQASSLGRIRNCQRIVRNGPRSARIVSKQILKQHLGKNYYTVKLYQANQGTPFQVHTLIMNAFVGPRPVNMQVRHGLKGKLNNTLSNLSYGTDHENRLDRWRDGTMANAKSIQCSTRTVFRSIAEAASFVGVSKSSIQHVLDKPHRTCKGFKWKLYPKRHR